LREILSSWWSPGRRKALRRGPFQGHRRPPAAPGSSVGSPTPRRSDRVAGTSAGPRRPDRRRLHRAKRSALTRLCSRSPAPARQFHGPSSRGASGGSRWPRPDIRLFVSSKTAKTPSRIGARPCNTLQGAEGVEGAPDPDVGRHGTVWYRRRDQQHGPSGSRHRRTPSRPPKGDGVDSPVATVAEHRLLAGPRRIAGVAGSKRHDHPSAPHGKTDPGWGDTRVVRRAAAVGGHAGSPSPKARSGPGQTTLLAQAKNPESLRPEASRKSAHRPRDGPRCCGGSPSTDESSGATIATIGLRQASAFVEMPPAAVLRAGS